MSKVLSFRKKYLKQVGLDTLLVNIIPVEKQTYIENWEPPYSVHNGLRSILAFIKIRGRSAEILFNLDPALSQTKTQNSFIKEIIRKRPLLLGFSPHQMLRKYSYTDLYRIEKIVKRLQSYGVFPYIVFGGHFASLACKELMNDFPWIDFIVRGEGELTFNELISTLKKKGNLRKILGLSFRWRGGLVENPPRPNIKDLDSLPFPAQDHLEFARKNNMATNVAAICSSRGCYGNCSFCSIQSFYSLSSSNNCWRARSPKNVVDEIELLVTKFACWDFRFYDDNFFGPGQAGEKRAAAIANEIIRRGLRIKFSIYCRSSDIEENIIKILKKAGLRSITMGIESGSNEGLKTYSKGVTIAQNREALLLLNKMGIKTNITFIFLNPYSTLEEIKKNISFYCFVRSLKNVFFWSNYIILNPLEVMSGTPIKTRLENDDFLHGNYITGFAYNFKDKRIKYIKKICKLFLNTESIYDTLIDYMNKSHKNKHQVNLYREKTTKSVAHAIESIRKAIDILQSSRPYKINAFLKKLENELGKTNQLAIDKLNFLYRKSIIVDKIFKIINHV